MSGQVVRFLLATRTFLGNLSPLIVIFVTLAAMPGCGHSNKNEDISEPPVREGDYLEKISQRYDDDEPMFDASGTKVVFVSGYTASDDVTPVKKIYKVDWASGKEPGDKARITKKDDYGTESAAAIAADGKLVAFVATVDGQRDLYVQDYAGTKDPVRVTNDAALESLPRFSAKPDSKLLAYLSFDPATSAFNVKVVDVAAAPTSVGSPKALTKDSDYISTYFWIPTASGYLIATGEGTADAGDVVLTYSKRSFANADAVESAAKTTWLSNFRQAKDIQGAASDTSALMARMQDPTGTKMATRTGDSGETTPEQTSVVSEPVFAAVSNGTVSDFADPPGNRLESLDMPSSGSTGFLMERNLNKCKDGAVMYGRNNIVIAKSDGTVVGTFAPRADVIGVSFEVASNLCDKTRGDGSVARMDDKMVSLAVNHDATATKYRLAYVSRFSTAFDPVCGLKVGDKEIYVVDVDGDQKKIYSLSKNLAPLVNDPTLAGKGPCVF